MAQYVIQIQTAPNGVGVGWLVRSFIVSEESPIPTDIPSNIVQVILTNTTSYNGIVAGYGEYTKDAIFSYDDVAEIINCTGAVTDSWPKD